MSPSAHNRLSRKSCSSLKTVVEKLIRTVVSLSLVAVTTAIPFSPLAQAQIPIPVPVEEVRIDAIPPRSGEEGDLTAAPGEVIQTSIRVRNSSKQPLSIESTAIDFVIGEDGQTPVPITDTNVSQRWSLANWMTLSPQFQDIGPNQIGQVNVLITIPEDALPGGHYAMVTHSPVSPDQDATSNAAIQNSAAKVDQQVGTLFYVIVEGPINEEAYIRELKIPKFTEYGPVPMALSIDNQSDIHIRPQITITIKNIFGQTIDSIQIEPKNIFPISSRDYQTSWDRIWGIGPYTATATMSFGQSGQLVVATEQFWLFPITIFWIVVISILAVVAIGIAVKRHLLHRNDVNKKKVEELEKKVAELEKTKELDA